MTCLWSSSQTLVTPSLFDIWRNACLFSTWGCLTRNRSENHNSQPQAPEISDGIAHHDIEVICQHLFWRTSLHSYRCKVLSAFIWMCYSNSCTTSHDHSYRSKAVWRCITTVHTAACWVAPLHFSRTYCLLDLCQTNTMATTSNKAVAITWQMYWDQSCIDCARFLVQYAAQWHVQRILQVVDTFSTRIWQWDTLNILYIDNLCTAFVFSTCFLSQVPSPKSQVRNPVALGPESFYAII